MGFLHGAQHHLLNAYCNCTIKFWSSSAEEAWWMMLGGNCAVGSTVHEKYKYSYMNTHISVLYLLHTLGQSGLRSSSLPWPGGGASFFWGGVGAVIIKETCFNCIEGCGAVCFYDVNYTAVLWRLRSTPFPLSYSFALLDKVDLLDPFQMYSMYSFTVSTGTGNARLEQSFTDSCVLASPLLKTFPSKRPVFRTLQSLTFFSFS